MNLRFRVLVVLVFTAFCATQPHSFATSQTSASSKIMLPLVVKSVGTSYTATPPFFAYYYLWWSLDHWKEKLGSDYPWAGSWPLPGNLDPTTGCGATSSFAGSTLTDLPIGGPYDQATIISSDQLMSSIYATHVRQASTAGLTGFLAGWQGTSRTGQSITDTGYNKRLDLLIRVIQSYNQATNNHFHYVIDYETFGQIKTPTQIANDIEYLLSNYGGDEAWARIGGKVMFRWSNSKDFPLITLKTIYERFGERLYIIGEERSTTWTSDRARYLDAAGHYWSSQDPYRNPQSFKQMQAFAAQIHADGRRWFAPLAPGYNDELNEQAQGNPVGPDDCVPRKGSETLQLLYAGNRASSPDGWFVISWNEWVEHTYIEPSKRYGSLYVNALAQIISISK